jgi:hypothetical protein
MQTLLTEPASQDWLEPKNVNGFWGNNAADYHDAIHQISNLPKPLVARETRREHNRS